MALRIQNNTWFIYKIRCFNNCYNKYNMCNNTLESISLYKIHITSTIGLVEKNIKRITCLQTDVCQMKLLLLYTPPLPPLL